MVYGKHDHILEGEARGAQFELTFMKRHCEEYEVYK